MVSEILFSFWNSIEFINYHTQEDEGVAEKMDGDKDDRNGRQIYGYTQHVTVPKTQGKLKFDIN